MAKLEMGMRFAYVIQSRKVRAWAVLIALAIMVILIVAVFLQSRRSPNRLKWTTCMACWIKWLPEVGTDHPL